MASALSLILGLFAVGSKWNGSATVNAGWPVSQWKINFCGSVEGWPALCGVLLIITALVLFLTAVVSGAKPAPGPEPS